MEAIISLIVGLFFGVLMMCLLQATKINDYINIVKILIEAIDHEIVCAVEEKKPAEYIKGMREIYLFIKKFFKEELEDE